VRFVIGALAIADTSMIPRHQIGIRWDHIKDNLRLPLTVKFNLFRVFSSLRFEFPPFNL
jgi:hypothetical protein